MGNRSYYFFFPLYKFFTKNRGWVEAQNLTTDDAVMLHGTFAAFVKDVWTEELTEPVTVYNFEVAVAHTYFVSERNVLVHNKNCGATGKIYNSADDAYAAARKDLGIKPNEKPINIFEWEYYDDGTGYFSPARREVYSGNRAIVNHGRGHSFSDGGYMNLIIILEFGLKKPGKKQENL